MDREDLSSEANNDVLLARGRSTDKRKKTDGYGKGRGRFKSRTRLRKDECDWCHDLGHWVKDCNEESDDASDFSLTVTPSTCTIADSTWVLDTGATVIVICSIHIKMHDGMVRELKEVIFVPAIKKNLISLGTLEAKGYKIVVENGGNLWIVATEKTKLWHMRLAHPGDNSLHRLVQQDLLKGVIACKRVWVYTMRHKDEIIEIFVRWKKATQTQTGKKIRVLRSDNGGEYKSDPFLQVCHDGGIKRHFTVNKTPQQNGVAERMNRTLLEKVENKRTSTNEPLQQVDIDATPPIPVKSVSV
ncbi:uncharacterized protein LOC113339707 [Papaver somniferum]|uniref:uncharacterized protein LOC113339707 n=1 Tax=Papaver somniferum TaxID=3469 RepID=UPI000E6FD8E3|nr:uncharacterized protein LOC113339707 [Papaver somniferum]